MTTLRRRPPSALRTLLSVAAPVLAIAALAVATVQPAQAASGSRSRTRHTYGATMPAPAFEPTAAPRAGKRHKSGTPAHAAPGAHGVAHPATGRRGRRAQPEPLDERPAMWHADRRGSRSEPLTGTRHTNRHGYGPTVVAEVDRRSSDGFYTAHLHSTHGRRYGSAPVMVAAAPVSDTAPRPSPSQPARAYATGVSQPNGYDDMPAAIPAGVNIGTAMAMAAPGTLARPGQPAANMTEVVPGFGGEVALASPDPGTTHRRNHPVPAAAMGNFAPPPPANLAERNAITMAAVSPAILPEIYDGNGRLLTVAPLRGSHEVLLHQNSMAAADGLGRIQDEAELNRLRVSGALVDFPETGALHMNPQLPVDRRCARPWTVLFAIDIAHDFFERFHQPLYVTSAVRTVSFQMRLQRVNGNAAAIDGDAASPHLTGQALDFAKRGMSAAELAWMRAYLLPLMDSGKIDVEEEFQQACFHISVYRRYAATRGPAQVVAQVQGSGPSTPGISQP